MHHYEGVQGCLQTEGVIQFLLNTTPSFKQFFRDLTLDPWQHRLEANQVCLGPESRSSVPLDAAAIPGLSLTVCLVQARGMESGCFSVRMPLSPGQRSIFVACPQSPAEQFQTLCHRIFPNETSLFLYRLALAALTSPHF